jgi:PAS domain S-box-containing protein
MKKEIFVFSRFKEYASFCLLKNFDELCTEYINCIRELKVPYQDLLAYLSEKELKIFFNERLRAFLEDVINDNGLVEAHHIVKNWSEGKLAGINKYTVLPSDILLAFSARKNALLCHLPKYTNDIYLGLEIAAELNAFNLTLEEIIFKAYLDIQKEILNKKNEELLISNIELQKQIVEKTDTEKSLRAEKEFSETLINNSIDGIIAFDKRLYVTAWNKTLELQNGLTKSEVIGKKLFDVFPNYKNTEEGKAMEEVLTGKRTSLEDVPHKGKKGFYEINIIPLINERNEITGGLTIIHDITARKSAEDKIRNRESQLKEAQEIAHMGSWEWNIRSNIISWSDELYKIFGYSSTGTPVSQEMLFRHMFRDEKLKLTQMVECAFQNRQPFEFEIKINRKDGCYRFLLIKGKVQVMNRIPFQLMGIALDITERKEAEEKVNKNNIELQEKNIKLEQAEQKLLNINNELELRVLERTEQLSEINKDLKREISERQKAEEALRERNDELIKINSDLDNFIYTASHDLKAPISNIEGLVGTMKEELTGQPKEVEDIIEMVNLSILRFKSTIQDLTEITKTQKNVNEDITYIDVNSLLEEIKFSIKDMIKSSKAEVVADFCKYPDIKFSKANLKSVLFNLVSNAIKYKHPERIPEIHISCEREGDYVLLTVKDNGLGIHESQIDKIFTMFKRLHDHVEGSGIGLYIVKRIIDNSGGKIQVESEVGVGTTFKIYLKIN